MQDKLCFLSQTQGFLAGAAAHAHSGIFSLNLAWQKCQTAAYSNLVAANHHPAERLWFSSSICAAVKEPCCLDLRLVDDRGRKARNVQSQVTFITSERFGVKHHLATLIPNDGVITSYMQLLDAALETGDLKWNSTFPSVSDSRCLSPDDRYLTICFCLNNWKKITACWRI